MSHEDSAIPLPWVSRLAKLNGEGRGKCGEVGAATKHDMVANIRKGEREEKQRNGRQLVMIKR